MIKKIFIIRKNKDIIKAVGSESIAINIVNDLLYMQDEIHKFAFELKKQSEYLDCKNDDYKDKLKNIVNSFNCFKETKEEIISYIDNLDDGFPWEQSYIFLDYESGYREKYDYVICEYSD